MKREINKTIDNKVKTHCTYCQVTTNHKIVASYNEYGKERTEYGDVYQWNSDYEIIECLGCETVSFRSDHTNSEDIDPTEGRYYSYEKFYPKRSADTKPIKEFLNLPRQLKRIYKETIESYNNEILTLCSGGVRALVEGLCLEHGIKNGNVTDSSGTTRKKSNLEGKINGLYEAMIITKTNAEILHEHRFLGNKGLHELSIPSKKDLLLAIEILENIFENIYELPIKGSRLKSSRGK